MNFLFPFPLLLCGILHIAIPFFHPAHYKFLLPAYFLFVHYPQAQWHSSTYLFHSLSLIWWTLVLCKPMVLPPWDRTLPASNLNQWPKGKCWSLIFSNLKGIGPTWWHSTLILQGHDWKGPVCYFLNSFDNSKTSTWFLVSKPPERRSCQLFLKYLVLLYNTRA